MWHLKRKYNYLYTHTCYIFIAYHRQMSLFYIRYVYWYFLFLIIINKSFSDLKSCMFTFYHILIDRFLKLLSILFDMYVIGSCVVGQTLWNIERVYICFYTKL